MNMENGCRRIIINKSAISDEKELKFLALELLQSIIDSN